MRWGRAYWDFREPEERRERLGGLLQGFKTLVWDRHRWVSRWAVTLVLLAVIYYTTTAAVAWLTAPRIEMTMSPLTGPVAVAAEPAKVQQIMDKVTYTGSISPYQEVTVYPRWEGWVQEFKLYEGDRVEQGQVVARLDRAEIGAVVEQARSMVAQAEGEVRQMEAQLARAKVEVAKAAEERAQAEAALKEAEAMLNVARADLKAALPGVVQAKAELDYIRGEFKRDEVLLARGAIGQASFDQRRAQYVTAQERVAQAEARVAQMEARVTSMEAKIVSAKAGINRAIANQQAAEKHVLHAEAALDSARARVVQVKEEYERRKVVLGYTTVEAPITGRVAKRHIYAGILVKPGMPIVDLQDLSRARVQAKVAEKDLVKVRVGTEAVVTFPALPEGRNRVNARVTTIFPQLDPVTRTTTIEMVVPNPGELIKTDMYAVVDLILERKPKAVTIPRLAVERDQQGQPKVFVTDGVSAMLKPVKLGIASGDRIEILDGVKEGEMVIFKGQRGLVEGQQVNIVAGL
ncbi:MAG: efflux RND transporter periplasmic adaptor subunit [Candidatus Rokubacteria bacterium]|nr:efflux RND transporter periplasmic adaptor subunit [Candidatus Rokubacteria bacterium]